MTMTEHHRTNITRPSSSSVAQRLFCLGYGQAVAQFVATYPLMTVSACARTPEKCHALRAKGIDAHLWDPVLDTGLDPRGAQALEQSAMIIVSAPPRTGTTGAPDPFFAPLADSIARMVARQTSPPIIVYLSSTNVYGNFDGGWVDEHTPPNPSSSRGEARLRAEADWQSLGARTHVLRLAGIYGYKRNQIRKLLSGRARQLIKPGHVFNRIHEVDIAQAIHRAWHQPCPGIYNIADDEPAPPQEVLQYAATLCGATLPAPEDFAQASLHGLAQEFYRDNKRVANTRLKQWLGRALIYPDYRTGLSAIWALGVHQPE